MDEYISRSKALSGEEFFGEHATWDNPMTDGCMAVRSEFIMDLPAADVAPVRRGRWVWDPDGMDCGLGAWCCSSCKTNAETWWANDRKYNPLHCAGGHFCGNCGAQMVT